MINTRTHPQPSYVTELLDVVARAEPRLLELDDDASARHPGPGKWSPREIVGHLIDSASNNHERLVRAQGKDDLILGPRWLQ